MRRAMHADIPRLLELGAAMHAESRFAKFEIDLKKAEGFFRALLGMAGAILLVDGEPVHSMFFGYAEKFWWGEELEAYDILLYVAPAHRGGPSAPRLIRGYIKAAQEMGAADIKIATFTGINSERTLRFFEHMGFKNTGAGLHFNGNRTVH